MIAHLRVLQQGFMRARKARRARPGAAVIAGQGGVGEMHCPPTPLCLIAR